MATVTFTEDGKVASDVNVVNNSSEALGQESDPAWSGSGDGSVTAILKSIHGQNQQAISLLQQIADNTSGGSGV